MAKIFYMFSSSQTRCINSYSNSMYDTCMSLHGHVPTCTSYVPISVGENKFIYRSREGEVMMYDVADSDPVQLMDNSTFVSDSFKLWKPLAVLAKLKVRDTIVRFDDWPHS